VSGSDTFPCDRFQAAFISPRIANQLLSDPLTDEILLQHTDSRSFHILREFICGESVILDEENEPVLIGLIEDLGNVELGESVMKSVCEREELKVSNCICRLKLKRRLDLAIAEESDFIGSHISEIAKDEIVELEVSVLSDILRSESIRIPSEDWLLEFVVDLGDRHSGLLEDVRVEYLSGSGIDVFFGRISHNSLDDRLWQQLWTRCRHQIVYDTDDILWNRCDGFVHRRPESAWSGLISHLTEFCGGNVHVKGLVAITCSSNLSNQCWDVVNYNWDDFWGTQSSPNGWIQFDFKDRLVSLSHYALKSDGGAFHLLQWALQGSVDGNSWTDLDRRNTQELNGHYVTKIFPCDQRESSSTPHFYRYIRLTQTGKNSYGDDYLMLGNFECFGWMVNLGNIGVFLR
jgi:hypothetical protein